MTLLLVEFFFGPSTPLRNEANVDKNEQLIKDFIEKYYTLLEECHNISESLTSLTSRDVDVTNAYYVYIGRYSAPPLRKDILGVTAVKIRTGHIHISLILIAPAWRRRGLATYALKHVIKSTAPLRDSGSVLTVSVTFEDPHLLQFYKKHGFEISHLDTASGLYTMTYCV